MFHWFLPICAGAKQLISAAKVGCRGAEMMDGGGGVLVPQPLHVKQPASPLPALTASSRGGVLPKARNRTAAAAVLTSIGPSRCGVVRRIHLLA